MIIQSSWKVADDRPISDAVVSSVESESADLEDEIMVENCVLLEAPDIGDGMYPTVPACQLLISCEPPHQISRISVLCEARVIEIYGHHGEYLKTVKNILLEEAEDMIVFRGDVVLDRPSSLCSIKFLLLRSPNEMWLYGMKIQTAKVISEMQNQMTIPLASVEQRLTQMGLVLSDKAEAFKQLVQNCQKSPIGDQDISDMIANLAMQNLVKNKSPSPEKNLQISNLMNSVAEQLEKRDSQNNLQDLTEVKNNNYESSKKLISTAVSTSPVMFERVSVSVQTEEEYINLETKLKDFVTEQIQESNKNIWEKIDKKFQEMEAKIVCKLEEIESFVKPQGIQN
ncbi:uncharacterized protein LOC129984340 [Argiope bruennichi]|uniref:Uncharacterized protein n=1 Tax=Argiope bruennichi TaxID=94029 RepID=A0A8T0EKZ2_ARGBR|nr:uncharacterized protein LOC129984340 [Argiope bruennichi]KAF8774733.1 hypothetical protein HNY73_017252 [Argiope bruennichi]